MLKFEQHSAALAPLANGLSQAVRLALPVIFLPFVARLLGPDETGTYLFYMQASVWLAVLADAGFSLYFLEFAGKVADDSEIHRFFWTDYFARLLMYVFFGLAALGIAFTVGGDLPLTAVSIVTAWVLGNGLSVLRHFRGSVATVTVGDFLAAAVYGATITAALPRFPTAFGALSAFSGSLFIGTLVHSVMYRPIAPKHLFAALVPSLRHIARNWWFLAMRLAGAFQAQAIILLTAILYGASAAGRIGVAERLFAATNSLIVVAAGALSPVVVRAMRRADSIGFQVWHKVTMIIVVLLACVYSVACIASDSIVENLFGPSYGDSHVYFVLLSITYLASAFNVMFLLCLAAPIGASRSMFIPTVLSLVLMLLITFSWPKGLDGILIGRLAAELGLASYAMHLLWGWRRGAAC